MGCIHGRFLSVDVFFWCVTLVEHWFHCSLINFLVDCSEAVIMHLVHLLLILSQLVCSVCCIFMSMCLAVHTGGSQG